MRLVTLQFRVPLKGSENYLHTYFNCLVIPPLMTPLAFTLRARTWSAGDRAGTQTLTLYNFIFFILFILFQRKKNISIE